MGAPRSDGLVLVGPDGPVLQVLAAGPGTLVQDAGRTGWAAAGVGHAGPADRVAAGQALTLVGAAGAGNALLEVLLGGLTLAVQGGPVLLAVTGARVAVTVDDRPVPFGAPVAVPPGAVVELGRVKDGACRSYLAVAGGLQVVRVLGSSSTDSLSGLGPPPVAAGTRLAVDPACVGRLPGRVPESSASAGRLPGWVPVGSAGVGRLPGGLRRVAPRQVPDPVLLRLLPGPRHGWFTDDVRQRLADGVWTVGPASSRVGLRLAGPELPRRSDDELPSEGLVRGALQVPPGGDFVLFGPDHPVTGGYPVVGVVDTASSDLAGQLPVGHRVRFVPTGEPEWGP